MPHCSPDGYRSLQAKALPQQGADSSYAKAVWTPVTSAGNAILRTREQRSIGIENVRLQKTLAEVYRSRTLTTHGQYKETGPTVDCTARCVRGLLGAQAAARIARQRQAQCGALPGGCAK